MSDRIPNPEAGATSVRFGPAFLRPASTGERDHYELMRPIVTVKNEGDRNVTEAHPNPVGPLAIYRTIRRGDRIPNVPIDGPPPKMRTMDAKGQPIELILVWWPLMT